MGWCNKGAEEIWEELITGFEDSSLGNMIISAEMFMDFSYSHEYYKLVDAVGENLSRYEVKIIAYLRDHIPYIRSMYKQIIKDGDLFQKEEMFLLSHLNGWHMSFYPTLQNWARVFEKENMLVDNYIGTKYGEGGLYRDFARKIYMEWHDNFKLPKNNINISISLEWVEAKRIFNLINNAPNPVRLLMDDQNAGQGLRGEDLEKINRCIQKDIELIEDEFVQPNSFKFEPLDSFQLDAKVKSDKSLINKVALLMLANSVKNSEMSRERPNTDIDNRSWLTNSSIRRIGDYMQRARRRLFG